MKNESTKSLNRQALLTSTVNLTRLSLVVGFMVFLNIATGCSKSERKGLSGNVTVDSEKVSEGRIQFISQTSNMVFVAEIEQGYYSVEGQLVDDDYLIKVEVEGSSRSSFEHEDTLSADETTRDINIDSTASPE